MQDRDYDFIRDDEEIDRLCRQTCDECGSTGKCHPNCSHSDSYVREASDPEGYKG